MKFSSPLEDITFQKFKKDVRVNSETDERQKHHVPSHSKRKTNPEG